MTLIQYSTIKYHPNSANCKLQTVPIIVKKVILKWEHNLHFCLMLT